MKHLRWLVIGALALAGCSTTAPIVTGDRDCQSTFSSVVSWNVNISGCNQADRAAAAGTVGSGASHNSDAGK